MSRTTDDRVRDVMTRNPMALPLDTPIREAARKMRDLAIGDVLVLEEGRLCGIVTDRDLVVRGLASFNGEQMTLGDICTRKVATVSPDDTAAEVMELMRRKAVRRIPVVENDRPVGIISIGDLAVQRDERSVLAGISAAPANN